MIVNSVGLICPVGLSSEAACAALRAGISAFSELPYWDREHNAVIGASVPGLDEYRFGDRLVALLAEAIGECLSNLSDTRWDTVPLIVGTAEPTRPGGSASAALGIVARVERALGVRFHPRLSKVIPMGHTAGFQGLGIARDLMATVKASECLVCGVDSYMNASTLQWLDQVDRLKRDSHSDGVVPGEAAVALHVRHETVARGVQIAGLGFGQESSPLLSGEPLLGRGLANAARAALQEAGWGLHDVDFRMSDVTGETYGFREHTLAEARLVTQVRIEPQPLWHPAECIGDTGAAAALVQIAWLTAAMQKGYAPGQRALCFASSLSGSRAVAACTAAHPGSPSRR